MSRRRRQQAVDQESKQIEEAVEERAVVEDQAAQISDQGDGEDLQENASKDYEQIEELDKYESEGVDQQEVEDDPQARKKAEEELADRDRRMHKRDKRGQLDVDDYLQEDMDYELRLQQRRQMFFREDEQQEDDIDEKRYLDAEQVKGKLTEWIKEVETIKFIKSKFSKFLKSFQGSASYSIYSAAIRDMCTNNRQSIQINYEDLANTNPTLAMWVGMEPLIIFPYLNETAYQIACRNYPSFQNIHPQVFVKIKNLPILDKIRQLRYIHLNKLVHIQGVVTKRSQVYNQLKKIYFRCVRCGLEKGPYYINNINDVTLGQCTSCQSNGPFPIDKQATVYRNYQHITVQESPSEVPAGRIPRQKQVILLGDNIDVARPGDEIQLIGTYMNRYSLSLNVKQGFPVFSTMIEANYIRRINEVDKVEDFTDQEKYRAFSKKHNLDQIIINSLAPSIYGHQNIKMGLALALFGGVQKVVQQTHRIRGDINVLIMGDPGTAKSQFLKSVQRAFHRCVYTTGKGASGVGLTASVKKDFGTNEWILQAGALVLADKGVCLIDQFDKMNQNDRTSIHEAMEQQSISISKAGIVTTLRARCSVIAAANPINGRYNSQQSFRENVDLTDPILSRFDILCVVKDQINEQLDHDLSTFVLNSHMKNHPNIQKYNLPIDQLQERSTNRQLIDVKQLKGYIRYARQKCKPILGSEHQDTIKQFYIKLREQSVQSGGINIAVRHIESIIRMATAHAKMHLRNEVKKEDVSLAISVMLRSFIETQKYSVSKNIMKKFANFL